MAVKPKFGFGLNLLTQEADYVLKAAEANAAVINPRLEDGFVVSQRTLLGTVRGDDASQKGQVADVGGLTLAQKTALKEMNRLLGDAKSSAKRAFKGQAVKLRNGFQIGINKPNDLASLLGRGRLVLAACGKVENASALAKKGWLAADTAALSAAIEELDGSDDTQETAKVDKKGATNTHNEAANELYEGLLTIQNAAKIQFPDNGNGNTALRAKFRLGSFPPKVNRKKKKTDAPPTPPATPQ